MTDSHETSMTTPVTDAAEAQLSAEMDGMKLRLASPPITVICGSTRFMAEMAEEDCVLTWAGHVVLKPGCDMKQPHELWANRVHAEVGKRRLDELHRAKIRLADEVVIVGSYIGDSTRAEIEYARSLGKPVRFTHPEVDPAAGGARCTCADAGACFAPAGHYADCPVTDAADGGQR